jgi:flagellar assembly protein FliH
MYEVTIPFSRAVRGVVLADPNAPLPSPPPHVQPEPHPQPPIPQAAGPDKAEQDRQLQEEKEAVQCTLASLRETAHTVAAQWDAQLAEMKRITVELAVTIAARLLHEKIEEGKFAVEALVHKVVEQLEPRLPVTVYLHPKDLALLEQRLGPGQPVVSDNREVRLAADPALERGDCRVESSAVKVVSQLKAQMEEIRQHLLRSVEHAQSGR